MCNTRKHKHLCVCKSKFCSGSGSTSFWCPERKWNNSMQCYNATKLCVQQSFTLFRRTTSEPASCCVLVSTLKTALEIYQYMRRINKKGIGFSTVESWSLIIARDHKSRWQGELRWEMSTSPTNNILSQLHVSKQTGRPPTHTHAHT